MTNQEAIRHLENMKWLKGYDNTTVGGVPLGDIIDQIIALLEEQEEPKQVIRKQCQAKRLSGAIYCYAEWYCPHCNSLLRQGYGAPWIKRCFNCGKPVAWEDR